MPPPAPGNMGKYAFWGTILLVAMGMVSAFGRKRSNTFAPIEESATSDAGADTNDAAKD